MQDSIGRKILLMFISFIIATVIWAIIANSIRPYVSDYVTVSIAVRNEETIQMLNKSYVVKAPLLCRVNYLISKDKRAIIRQSDFRAYIDLNDLMTTNDLPVHYEALNDVDKNVSNIRIEPATVRVELEDTKRIEIPISYNILGTLEDGHSVGDVILSPNIVYISGNDAAISEVSHASINIPINAHDENFTDKAEIYLIDKDGKEISKENFELSANEINYTVSIFSMANVILNAVTEGEVAKGSSLENVVVEPNSIIIEGPRSVIENVYTIDLPVVDINGMNKSFEYELELASILPVGTRCTNEKFVKVKVNINTNEINEPTAKVNTDKNVVVEEEQ